MNLNLSAVSVSYGEHRVVHDVDLAIAQGGWLTLIGPNGAGKSSLLRAIAGLVACSGRIAIGDRALPEKRRDVARLVAFVPQRPELPGDMTVGDYVGLGRTPYLPLIGSEGPTSRRIIAETVERLDLVGLERRRLSEISGGESQRAVIARALVQSAPVLLLDEPTTGLDLGHQQDVLELVDALRAESGLTVVAAMHDLSLAGQFADALALIAAGRLVTMGAASVVLTPELLEAHFAARVERLEDRSGHPVLVPVRDAVGATRTGRSAPGRAQNGA